jgi:hypothetical protein
LIIIISRDRFRLVSFEGRDRWAAGCDRFRRGVQPGALSRQPSTDEGLSYRFNEDHKAAAIFAASDSHENRHSMCGPRRIVPCLLCFCFPLPLCPPFSGVAGSGCLGPFGRTGYFAEHRSAGTPGASPGPRLPSNRALGSCCCLEHSGVAAFSCRQDRASERETRSLHAPGPGFSSARSTQYPFPVTICREVTLFPEG